MVAKWGRLFSVMWVICLYSNQVVFKGWMTLTDRAVPDVEGFVLRCFTLKSSKHFRLITNLGLFLNLYYKNI